MKSQYAFVVCADIRYLPEVVALLGSLDYVGNTSDVHFFGYQIPKEIQEQFILLNYQVIFHEITDEEIQESHGLSEVVCRKRYFYANQIGREYRAVCVLDADMIFTRNPVQFFVIAEKTGFVLGCNKEQNEAYNDPHHQHKGKWLIPEGYWNDKDLTNCPLFVDTKIWGRALARSYEIFLDGFPDDNFKGPDMAALCICLIEAGARDRIVKLPNLQWLGTNEALLKTYTKAVCKGEDNNLWTENGLEIFSYHGQFFHHRWREQQLLNRKGCIAGRLNNSEKSYGDAISGLETLTKRFFEMLDHKIKIEYKNYRHPELPYEK